MQFLSFADRIKCRWRALVKSERLKIRLAIAGKNEREPRLLHTLRKSLISVSSFNVNSGGRFGKTLGPTDEDELYVVTADYYHSSALTNPYVHID